MINTSNIIQLSLTLAEEAYLEPCQRATIDIFWSLIVLTKNSIRDVWQGPSYFSKFVQFPPNIYLFKVNNRPTTKRCQLTIKTTERRHLRRSGVFIVNSEDISPFFSSASIVDFEQVFVCCVWTIFYACF